MNEFSAWRTCQRAQIFQTVFIIIPGLKRARRSFGNRSRVTVITLNEWLMTSVFIRNFCNLNEMSRIAKQFPWNELLVLFSLTVWVDTSVSREHLHICDAALNAINPVGNQLCPVCNSLHSVYSVPKPRSTVPFSIATWLIKYAKLDYAIPH